MILRFPLAGLATSRRPAYWEGDFDQWRSSGFQHHAYDIFEVDKAGGPARYRGAAVVSPVFGRVRRTWRYEGQDLPGVNTSQNGPREKGGWYAWIEGDDGLFYYFAHMAEPSPLSLGQAVKPGTLVGHMGDSGNATGRPHLHFAVKNASGQAVKAYDDLRRIEPTAWLAPAGSRVWLVVAGVVTGLVGVGAVGWAFWGPSRRENRRGRRRRRRGR